MKIAVWKTGHEIADTVAEALAEGFNAYTYNTKKISEWENTDDASIGYGILRGMGDVFDMSREWFNVDRGYLKPAHFDGYYRISYRGTQARWHEGIPRKPIDIKLEPWRTGGDYVLICPPTEAVCSFFHISPQTWLNQQIEECRAMPYMIRHKGGSQDIDWHEVKSVITFNSSVGWQALQKGIPVLSDPHHSIVGSYYAQKNINTLQSLTDNLSKMEDTRLELFEAMAAHQFTLQEIREGKAWPLIRHYIAGLDGIAENPLPLMSAPIASHAGLRAKFQSIT